MTSSQEIQELRDSIVKHVLALQKSRREWVLLAYAWLGLSVVVIVLAREVLMAGCFLICSAVYLRLAWKYRRFKGAKYVPPDVPCPTRPRIVL